MLTKLFGNRDARQMTVKGSVEMIFAGGFIAEPTDVQQG